MEGDPIGGREGTYQRLDDFAAALRDGHPLRVLLHLQSKRVMERERNTMRMG